jgi:hypothetical protein
VGWIEGLSGDEALKLFTPFVRPLAIENFFRCTTAAIRSVKIGPDNAEVGVFKADVGFVMADQNDVKCRAHLPTGRPNALFGQLRCFGPGGRGSFTFKGNYKNEHSKPVSRY